MKMQTAVIRGFCAVLFGFLLTGAASAGIYYYVSTTGDGTDGSSWAKAYTNIQPALTQATNGDTVCIAGGQTFTNSQELVFTNSGVSVIGGYEGVGAPGNHDSTLYGETIIRRNVAATDMRIMSVNAVSGGRLEGVTLTGGNTSGNGGAISIANSTQFVVANCTLRGNTATNNTTGISGGALYAEASSGIITNCIIESNLVSSTFVGFNTTFNGGGVGLAGTWSAWTICNSVISHNTIASTSYDTGDGAGGGIFMTGAYSRYSLKNCLIAHNSSRIGDGIAINGFNGPVAAMDNCTVADNNGEGVYVWMTAALNLHNSILWQNGNDVRVENGGLSLSYCDIGNGDSNGVSGCVSVDPLFVDNIYYHLKSKRGNYVNGYFSGGSWPYGGAYSPLLDLGDPASPYNLEPMPNGNRVNMGAYANTPVASLAISERGTVFVIR